VERWRPRSSRFTAFSSLPINQDCLLPWTWRFVGTMNAACPAAGAFLALQQFVTGPLDATLARLWLFCIIYPADELIPTERRQAFPQHKDFRIRSQRCLKVFVCFVDSAMWKSVRHATSGFPAGTLIVHRRLSQEG
jgi:hypothetical protein